MNAPAFALPRAAVAALIGAALLLLAALAGHLLQPQLNPPLRALRIDGALRHLSAAEIVAAAAVDATAPRLFEVDLNALRTRVEALPWVAQARVSRVWPDRIAVRVEERVPVARWNDASLIDRDSRVFTPKAEDLPEALPRLAAPAGFEAVTATAFQDLSAALQGSPFAPNGLSLDMRGEWRLSTASGLELRFGQGDPLAKTALLLGAVSRTLDGQLDRVAYVDLRYSNGFSVGWASGRACEALLRAAGSDRPGTAGPACKERTPGMADDSQQKSGDLLRSPNAKAEDKKHE